MGEMGKAMMGFGEASGVDRARIAADAAVASPLLEGIELSGARGVLVNITASSQIGMREIREVMAAIQNYTREDATVKFGTVIDEGMEDRLRVTVVATGLGSQGRKRQAPPVLVHHATTAMDTAALRTGTDGFVVADAGASAPAQAASGSDLFGGAFTSGRGARNQAVEAMRASGVDTYDIPAFLRKQAD
jgi:cell division protein FtsZ